MKFLSKLGWLLYKSLGAMPYIALFFIISYCWCISIYPLPIIPDTLGGFLELQFRPDFFLPGLSYLGMCLVWWWLCKFFKYVIWEKGGGNL